MGTWRQQGLAFGAIVIFLFISHCSATECEISSQICELSGFEEGSFACPCLNDLCCGELTPWCRSEGNSSTCYTASENAAVGSCEISETSCGSGLFECPCFEGLCCPQDHGLCVFNDLYDVYECESAYESDSDDDDDDDHRRRRGLLLIFFIFLALPAAVVLSWFCAIFPCCPAHDRVVHSVSNVHKVVPLEATRVMSNRMRSSLFEAPAVLNEFCASPSTAFGGASRGFGVNLASNIDDDDERRENWIRLGPRAYEL
eukprot:Rmarinus@m.23806